MSLHDAIAGLEELVPGLSSGLVGVDQEAIDQIVKSVGYSIPEDYLEFLSFMGKAYAPVQFDAMHGGSFDCRFEVVKRFADSGKQFLHRNGESLFVFGLYDGPCQDCGPCCLRITNDKSPTVMQLQDSKPNEWEHLAPSLGQFIFVNGMTSVYLARFKATARTAQNYVLTPFSDRLDLDQFSDFLTTLGFKRHPFALEPGGAIFHTSQAALLVPPVAGGYFPVPHVMTYAYTQSAADSIAKKVSSFLQS